MPGGIVSQVKDASRLVGSLSVVAGAILSQSDVTPPDSPFLNTPTCRGCVESIVS